MSSLPDAKAFQSFTETDFSYEATPQSAKIDLNAFSTNLRASYIKEDAKQDGSISQRLYELYHLNFLRCAENSKWTECIGFSEKYQSLTISFHQDDECKTIAVRDANGIKWKTHGSKSFIPHKLTGDKFIFCAFGSSEIIAFEVLECDYLIFQSDSIAKSLHQNEGAKELPSLLKNKCLICLLDNDDSCKSTIEPLKSFFPNTKIVSVDFENMTDRDLPKGYDFRDFINEIAAQKKFGEPADEVVMNYLKNEVVRCLQI